jgi:L-rhamnose mutarotase
MSEETIAFRMVLKQGFAAEYERRHDAIWPELAAALRDAGVIDYRIFLDPQTNHLFAVMRRRSDHGLDALRASALMRRWWSMMADIMETQPDNVPCEYPLVSVFSLTTDKPK